MVELVFINRQYLFHSLNVPCFSSKLSNIINRDAHQSVNYTIRNMKICLNCQFNSLCGNSIKIFQVVMIFLYFHFETSYWKMANFVNEPQEYNSWGFYPDFSFGGGEGDLGLMLAQEGRVNTRKEQSTKSV